MASITETLSGLQDQVVDLLKTIQDPAVDAVERVAEKAIAADKALKPEQRTALLAVYRSYLEANEAERAKKPRA